MAVDTWDAIVIGAGPAGAIAARQLALAGREVLLVDRKTFPRHKVCGGCVGAAALTVLESLELRDRVQSVAGPSLTTFRVIGPTGQFKICIPPGLAVSRSTFDAVLVSAAQAAGVTFRDATEAEVGTYEADARLVTLNSQMARARMVIAADGLARSSLVQLRNLHRRVKTLSRIGAGCEFDSTPAAIESDTIHMIVGRTGYVGLVQIESGRLNIAAAISPEALSRSEGLGTAVARLLRDAKFDPGVDIGKGNWVGTPHLSGGGPVSDVRLLVIGDAAGYIEPFTGEGIGWSMLSGAAAAELANRACEQWNPNFILEWRKTSSEVVGRRQLACRALAALLKRPWVTNLAVRIAAFAPGVWLPIANRIQRPLRPLRLTPNTNAHSAIP